MTSAAASSLRYLGDVASLRRRASPSPPRHGEPTDLTWNRGVACARTIRVTVAAVSNARETPPGHNTHSGAQRTGAGQPSDSPLRPLPEASFMPRGPAHDAFCACPSIGSRARSAVPTVSVRCTRRPGALHLASSLCLCRGRLPAAAALPCCGQPASLGIPTRSRRGCRRHRRPCRRRRRRRCPRGRRPCCADRRRRPPWQGPCP